MLRVVRKVPHPRYNSRTNDNDLMLLQLERPARLGPRVRPISVASSCARVGSSCLVSGWGTISSPVGEGPCIGNEGLVAGPLGLWEEGLGVWTPGSESGGSGGLDPGSAGGGPGGWTPGSESGGARNVDCRAEGQLATSPPPPSRHPGLPVHLGAGELQLRVDPAHQQRHQE